MSGSLEVKLLGEEDIVDMLFPKLTGFWMALQCSHYWEDSNTVNLSTKLELVPISILVVNGDKSRNTRCKRMRKRIFSITTIDLEIKISTDSKEQSMDWMFHTGRISECKSVQ